jgi:hypothetical protein
LHQDTRGHHLDPGGPAGPGLTADGEADPVADLLTQQLRDATGGGPRGQPAGLGHHHPHHPALGGSGVGLAGDRRVDRPQLQGDRVDQAREHQRDQRGLAGSGRRHQHGRPGGGERAGHVGQNAPHRKVEFGARAE